MSAPPAQSMFARPAETAALAGLSTTTISRVIGRGELRAVRLRAAAAPGQGGSPTPRHGVRIGSTRVVSSQLPAD